MPGIYRRIKSYDADSITIDTAEKENDICQKRDCTDPSGAGFLNRRQSSGMEDEMNKELKEALDVLEKEKEI